MEGLLNKPRITEVFNAVRTFSFQQKREAIFDEENINVLLYSIIDLKNALTIKTEKISHLVLLLEELTWCSDVDEECLMLINDVISSIKDLRATSIRQYVALAFIRSRNIAKAEIRNFKTAIDELKEIGTDLESVFFFLPAMPQFKETTKQLSLV